MTKIKIGQVGLGRLGKVHASNIVKHVNNAELYAVASVVEQELEYASDTLGVQHCYTSY
ncbi:inositol 2-dehydrogenase, partial [Mammaliicoccus sciuri]